MFLRETNVITLILTRTPSTIRPFAEQYPSHHRVIINPKLPFHPLLFPSSNPITFHDFHHNLCHDSRIINTWSENYDYTFLHRGASFVSPTVSTLANDLKRHLHRISRNSVSLRQLTYKVSLHSFTSPTTFSSSPFPFQTPPPFTSIANRVICPSLRAGFTLAGEETLITRRFWRFGRRFIMTLVHSRGWPPEPFVTTVPSSTRGLMYPCSTTVGS